MDGNRILLLPPAYSNDSIRSAVHRAIIEQHPDSPHLYLPDSVQIGPNANIVLVGASDGIFALSLCVVGSPRRGFLGAGPDMAQATGADAPTLAGQVRDRGEVHVRLQHRRFRDPGASPCIKHEASCTTFRRMLKAPKPECSKVRLARSAPIHHSAFRYAPITTMMMRLCCLGCFRRPRLRTEFSRGYFVLGLRAPYLRRGVMPRIDEDRTTEQPRSEARGCEFSM